jgi:hypothetical protein
MAFGRTGGYSNLSQGNFTPAIFSQKVLKFFRIASVAEDITNTDYAGEIQAFGDTVRIINEPTVSVTAYTRGMELPIQDVDDSETTLVVDQGNAFAFAVDDIEERQSHINWMELATGSGAYKLKDTFDSNVLTNIQGNVLAANVYGSNASPIDCGFAAGEVDPANILARLARLLDDQNVPFENRWAVAPPIFYEQLAQSPSKVMDMSVMGGGGESALSNGRVVARDLHGFRLYKSNNVPTPTGSNATQHLLAGHMSAVTTANHIAKTEVLRAERTFADIVRGLHIFGRKVLRTEGVADCFLLID